MNPFIKQQERQMLGMLFLLAPMLLVARNSKHSSGPLTWLCLAAGGVIIVLVAISRLSRGRWLVPKSIQDLPADAPAFRYPIRAGLREVGSGTRWVFGNLRERARVLLIGGVCFAALGCFGMSEMLTFKRSTRDPVTALVIGRLVPLAVFMFIVATSAFVCRKLLKWHEESEACLSLSDAATRLGSDAQALDAVLVARNICPRYVVDGVPKYHLADISGLDTLLRPAADTQANELLRPATSQGTDPSALLRPTNPESS